MPPSTKRLARAAAIALVAATPVATWWLVGDVSEPGPDLDYVIRPPELPAGVEGGLIILFGTPLVIGVLIAAAWLGL